MRTLVIAGAAWCGGGITVSLLELILNSFGFPAFAVVSTIASYFLFWFAWYGLPSLVDGNNGARLSGFFRPAGGGLLLALFTVTAGMVASCGSAILLFCEVAQTFPDRPALLWLIAVPFFGFIFYVATKLDESLQRGD